MSTGNSSTGNSNTGETNVDPLGDRLMNWFWRKPAETVGERMRRRVCVHLVPVLFFLYILAYLDRVNLSVAQLGMELSPEKEGLGIDRQEIGWAFGMFFWSYWILEIPSTLSVVRWGARWVFCRILILWGICAALTGLIGLPIATQTFGLLPQLPTTWPGWLGSVAAYVNAIPTNPLYQLHVFRILLGFFEGGFFPSVILYLTFWFRSQDRAKAVASFMTAIPLSSVFGMPASGLLLGARWFGLAGWRWVFIIEGILPILAGVAVLWFLPNRPADAKWLPSDERDALEGDLEREQQQKRAIGHGAGWHHVGWIALLTCVYFCLNVPSYGLGAFMPKIIGQQLASFGLDTQSKWGQFIISVVAALPYALAFLGMRFNGRHSDRTHERIFHVAVPLSMLSLGLFLAALFDGVQGAPLAIMICIVGPLIYAHQPAFWPIPSMFLGSAAAASAIGFINMIGNLGGSYGATVMGQHGKDESFRGGLLHIAPWPLGAAAIILVLGYVRKQREGAVAKVATPPIDST